MRSSTVTKQAARAISCILQKKWQKPSSVLSLPHRRPSTVGTTSTSSQQQPILPILPGPTALRHYRTVLLLPSNWVRLVRCLVTVPRRTCQPACLRPAVQHPLLRRRPACIAAASGEKLQLALSDASFSLLLLIFWTPVGISTYWLVKKSVTLMTPPLIVALYS